MSTASKVLGAIFTGADNNLKYQIDKKRRYKEEEETYNRNLSRKQKHYDDLLKKGFYETDLSNANDVAKSNGQIHDVYGFSPLSSYRPKEFAPQKPNEAEIAAKKAKDLMGMGVPKEQAIDMVYNRGRGANAKQPKADQSASKAKAGYGGLDDTILRKEYDRLSGILNNKDTEYGEAYNRYKGLNSKVVPEQIEVDDPTLTPDEKLEGILRKVMVTNPEYASHQKQTDEAYTALDRARLNKTIAERNFNAFRQKFYPELINFGGGMLPYESNSDLARMGEAVEAEMERGRNNAFAEDFRVPDYQFQLNSSPLGRYMSNQNDFTEKTGLDSELLDIAEEVANRKNRR